MYYQFRTRLLTALGAALILAALLAACDAGPDGSCRPPTPCHSQEGHNP